MFVMPGNRAGRGAPYSALYNQLDPIQLPYAATLIIDLGFGRRNNFWFILTGNVILNFKNGRRGQSGVIEPIQDGTGSRLLSGYSGSPMSVILPGGTAITLSTPLNSTDRLFFYVDHLGKINLFNSLALA